MMKNVIAYGKQTVPLAKEKLKDKGSNANEKGRIEVDRTTVARNCLTLRIPIYASCNSLIHDKAQVGVNQSGRVRERSITA